MVLDKQISWRVRGFDIRIITIDQVLLQVHKGVLTPGRDKFKLFEWKDGGDIYLHHTSQYFLADVMVSDQ